MAEYRLYFMSNSGNHIDGVEAIDALDDASAIQQAACHTGSNAIELWAGARKVSAFASAARGSGALDRLWSIQGAANPLIEG